MEQKPNPKIERVLSLVEPGRRDALRKILATAAYAAPVVASFSLDAAAGPATCLAANQTGVSVNFAGTVNCVGFTQVDGSNPEEVHLKLPVSLEFCEGSFGSVGGLILGGPVTFFGATEGRLVGTEFERKDKDTVGFTVNAFTQIISESTYSETGQWTRRVDKNGVEKLKGKSYVAIFDSLTGLGTTYTLACDYDLTSVPLV